MLSGVEHERTLITLGPGYHHITIIKVSVIKVPQMQVFSNQNKTVNEPMLLAAYCASVAQFYLKTWV